MHCAMSPILVLVMVLSLAVSSASLAAESPLAADEYPVFDPAVMSPLTSTASATAQLNPQGFAACLAREAFYQGSRLSLRELKARENLGPLDLFLPYLAIYPGKQLPLWPQSLQRRAQERWSYSWDIPSRQLAERMLEDSRSASAPWTPADWFRAGLSACQADVFCAVLVTHNVLRTLGRHEQGWTTEPGPAGPVARDYNAPWFSLRRAFWIGEIPALQSQLMPLRPDSGGDRWGEWYHFFGVLSFVLHESSARGSLLGVREIVKLNDRFNEWLVGSPEGAEKARLDLDAIEASRLFVSALTDPAPIPAYDCSLPSTYVAR